MPSKVFFGSPRQARLEAKETLPAKLDLILDELHLRERVKDETVALKMHTGNNMGYSTIHPVFVRRVVQAIKDGGGKPFVVDVNWDAEGAELRGYHRKRWDARSTLRRPRREVFLRPPATRIKASRPGKWPG